ncbi:helix-turn-helix transcriptional regulator [Myxococcus sp. CA051A]|uniref:Helix-turn-helix transcriptional regulator n=1 Tax=Myxococcus llanfairpwllgwyngyllgogerychwyrndrobwllllantysiliogogogochensis TaxID=2590453 RepID=A0A540X0C0_9BACT|nr:MULTISPECIES: helix-turn-helix domain-containing protein [Myxococcus]NTX04715.1 helix-turn-helix transcriptional regulator [Myxococcus sp. CA040A]NTX63788.1 helix-turn-helix transcriptional regulator [Myxococcus sp. CA051A]TQF14633.1 helix-turn-helix transcriptional regulator [Myxococcus llanfairpwllgwyngyllgogerychwyrndrobwllllantysiliogogogochensis]
MLGWPWFHLIVAPPRAGIEEGMRERLLHVAEQLVREHGLEALTLAAVARHAHVGRGAPRYHFGGKRGLVDALEEARRGNVVELRAVRQQRLSVASGRRQRAAVHRRR